MKVFLCSLLIALFSLEISADKNINIIKAPYHVQIERNKTLLCTGSIVNYKWLLTSATCVDGIKHKDIKIRSGASLMSKGGGLHSIRDIYIHPQFDSKKIMTNNNVALIQLWYHFVLSCTVFPMRKPIGPPLEGESAFYSTWISNTTHGAKLNFKRTSVLPTKGCFEMYPDCINCVCLNNNENKTCIDNGDPVLIDGNIQGLIMNKGCIEKTSIVVADLSLHTEWIDEVLKNNTKTSKGEKPPPENPCKLQMMFFFDNNW